jgi:FMN phosphatase YigB (HAD superfamily)
MIVRQCYNQLMEEVAHVAFGCRGTLVDWASAIDAVAYELARRNGESPLDRGASLGRRVEALADGDGLARGFERLVVERGYRGEESGAESLARVVALARPLCGAREAVQFAARSGRRVVAVARTDSIRALAPFGGAFEAVVSDPREIGAPPEAILYVSAAEWRRVEARRLGMRAAGLHELARALAAPPTILAVR